MTLINDWGINQFLARRLNVTDAPAPASTLAPEVMPVLQVAPPSVEDNYLRDTRHAAAQGVATGGVGSYGVWRIWNPTGSNTLLMLDWLCMRHFTAASSVYVGMGLGQALAVSGSNVYYGSVALDSRFRASATNRQTVGVCEGDGVAAPAFIGGPIALRIYQELNYIWPVNIVLAPGYCMDVFGATTNQSFIVNLGWRERRAQPSELV